MAAVLNRNGYRLRKVVKAKLQKKIPETDAILPTSRNRMGTPCKASPKVKSSGSMGVC
ncbi:MAG: hypothetical protein ACKN9W_08680 [Methylococcus sp.]